MSEKSYSLINAYQGHKTDIIPFWFMRQAGRYLPEYRSLRASKGGFLEMVYDPDAACEITIQPIRRFESSGAILFSDILVVPQAMGQRLEFEPGVGPVLEPVDNAQRLEQMGFDSDFLSPVYQTVRNLRQELVSEGFEDTALIGFAGAPWTVACYMVHGRGSKDFLDVKALSYSDPAFFAELMDKIVKQTTDYLIGQADAGAQALKIFDSWSGLCDVAQFEKWVIAPTRKIVDQVKAEHPDIPIIGFPKGAGLLYEAYAEQAGVDAIAIDSAVPTQWAAKTLQTKMPVQGNLDPALLLSGGQGLIDQAHAILKDLGEGPFVFNLGHGINKETPIPHVQELVDLIRDFRAG